MMIKNIIDQMIEPILEKARYMRWVAIDFDGTLCDSRYPECGPPIYPMIYLAKKLQQRGIKLLLWTCRIDSDKQHSLRDAVEWCKQYGLEFYGVNFNPDCPWNDEIDINPTGYRKILADMYIDDIAVDIQPLLKLYCEVNLPDESIQG